MSKQVYFGICVEAPRKLLGKNNLVGLTVDNLKIIEVNTEGAVFAEKVKDLFLVKVDSAKKHSNNMFNFAIVLELPEEEAGRLAKILNVLGNDRVVKEKLSTKKILSKLKIFASLHKLVEELGKIMPGFHEVAWYYAPYLKAKE